MEELVLHTVACNNLNGVEKVSKVLYKAGITYFIESLPELKRIYIYFYASDEQFSNIVINLELFDMGL